MAHARAGLAAFFAAVAISSSPARADIVSSSIASGALHSCALTTSGGVKCWGANSSSQLGDGTFAQRLAPVDVSGLAGVVAIAVGSHHTCALTSGGGVKCWGEGGLGQLGDGGGTQRSTPVDVSGLTSGVAAISARNFRTCALTVGGAMKCWGGNFAGGIGDNTTTSRLVPTDVSGLSSGIAAISVGDEFTCALTSGGGVKCWGANENGQLGDGSLTDRHTPVDVSGLASGVAMISAGHLHACAVTTGGGAKCWGRGLFGPLGNGAEDTSTVPGDVTGLTSGVAAIGAGGFHTCALTTGGAVKCFGNNSEGEIGDGTTTTRLTPVDVPTLGSGVTMLSVGDMHTCVLVQDRGPKCWGYNANGALGDGSTTHRSSPVDVPHFLIRSSVVVARERHTCLLLPEGALKCWGRNAYGQLGDGTNTNSSTPVDVTGLGSGVVAVATGMEHSCAITRAGTVKCWGLNDYGQLGDNTVDNSSTPVDVSGIPSGATAIGAGDHHTCAIVSGGLKCWGGNLDGQLGNGTVDSSPLPTAVTGLTSGVASLAVGWYQTCAVTTSGGAKCWGFNGDATYGQVGDGTDGTSILSPVDVQGLTSGVASISGGRTHTCAVTTGGAAKCWGRNNEGQLGDGSNTNTLGPVNVSGLGSGVAAITLGWEHTCVRTVAGAAKCWGRNTEGEVGDGTTTGRLTPVDVTGLTSGVELVAAGGFHTCARVSGAIKCWGHNSEGQLGALDFADSPVPALVPFPVAQSITFAQPAATLYTSPPFEISASATSTLGVTFDSWTPAACTVSGTTVTPIAPGMCVVRASQAGDASYLPAPQIVRAFAMLRSSQSIVFDPLPDRFLNAAPFTLSATPGGSNNPVTFSSLTPSVCVTSESAGVYSVTMQGVAGTCTVAADETGNATYDPAPQVTRSFQALKLNQAITFNALADKMATDPPFTITATPGASGNAVTFTVPVTTSICSVTTVGAVTTVTLTGTIGTCTVAANQAGNATYNAAPQVTQSFQVKTTQSITFGALVARLTSESPFMVSATGGPSGNAVSFTSSTPSVCTTDGTAGTVVTLTGAAGTCTLAANQSASSLYTTAPQVTQSFTVSATVMAAALGSGEHHHCVVTTAGGVKCWGRNVYRQLGDNTTTNQSTWVDVAGLSNVIMVAGGSEFSCALTTAGGVKCWGRNNFGQLGDNSQTDRPAPTDVSGLASGVVAIAVGYEFACALTVGGGVKCWGANFQGQLGDNTIVLRATPVNVSGLSSGVLAISTGGAHTCALTTSGGVKCWGLNTYGSLGDGTQTESHVPVDVSGLSSGVTAISAGIHHACVITSGGGMKCWGGNFDGQVGDGTATMRLAPVDVSGLASGVAAIATAHYHTCAITTAGAAKCWGFNNAGQVGDGSAGTQRYSPTDVAGLSSGVAAIDVGYSSTCALTNGGRAKCWGDNSNAQVGDATLVNRTTPVLVAGSPSMMVSVSGGIAHTCGVSSAGAVKCWGSNPNSGLGDNASSSFRTFPIEVMARPDGAAVAAGSFFACALTTAGGVKCWGYNNRGQVGDGSNATRSVPTGVLGLSSGVSAISVGLNHACARTTGGGLKCWGANDAGALGDGTQVDRWSFVDVSGLTSGVAMVATGTFHTCAVTTGGGVKCWGLGTNGQLGAAVGQRLVPGDVPTLTSGVAAISAGDQHTCALTTGGGVKCWGWNFHGQLGNNSTTASATPVDVVGLSSGVVAITAGLIHTCALTTGGGVKCWGYNNSGGLGNNSTTNSPVPVDVSTLSSGVVAVEAANAYTCAIAPEGNVKCWGANDAAQLGNPSLGYHPEPVDSGTSTQSISFTTAASKPMFTPFVVTATSTSGLTVTFDTWTPGTCTVSSAGNVTPVALGLCGIRARSAATPSYFGAPAQLRILQIVQVPITVAVSGPATSTTGQSVQFTATLSASANVGTVAFKDGAATISGCAAVAVSGTQAQCSTSALSLGAHSITAVYSGDTNYTAATSPAFTHTVLATFSVTPSAGANGTISPTGVQTVAQGSSAVFTVTPNSGYTATVASGAGSCGGNLVGTTYTTNAITANCTVDATFAFSGTQVFNVVLEGAQETPVNGALATGSGTVTVDAAAKTITYSFSNTGLTGALTAAHFHGPGLRGVSAGVKIDIGANPTTGTVSYLPADEADILAGNWYVNFHTAAYGGGEIRGQLDNLGAAPRRTLAVIRAGSGTGTVASDSAAPGISCGSQCTHSYPQGLTVVVTATAAAGSTFGGWGNCPSPSGNQCTATMSAARTVTASFTATAAETITTSIAAGEYHSCALTTSGGVMCWGLNGNGQLGDGTTTNRSMPTAVPALAGIVAITAGAQHTCALTTSGGVKCWGDNAAGQLGDGTNLPHSTPADVSGLTSGVVAISAGWVSTCALTTSGGVKCWGANSTYGQLGDGTLTDRNAPVDVSGLTSGVQAIDAGGAHVCVLTTAGGAMCWGSNGLGQVGDGTGVDRLVPTAVAGLASGVASISTGRWFSCAVTTGGAAKCWGQNSNGQVGDNSTTDRLAPVNVTGLAGGVATISAGGFHACALSTGGAVVCWGGNSDGRLGDGTTTQHLVATSLPGLASGIAALASGQGHTCALTTRGDVKCWGRNVEGQLGDGTNTQRTTAVNVAALSAGAASVGGSARHTCAITKGGDAKCWGQNSNGQLGNNSTANSPSPVDVSGLSGGVALIAGGRAHSCALTDAGGVKCWGANAAGQVGDGTTTDRLVPADATGLTSAVASLATGALHACALTASGGVKCWGANAFGQLGDNTITNRTTAIDVSGLASDAVAIAAGDSHSCAVTSGGGVKCWGANGQGQLGDNSIIERHTPVDVVGVSDAVALAAGTTHTCALTSGGGVKCWGMGGTVGDGTASQRLTATAVSGLASGVVAIAAGLPADASSNAPSHTCALLSNGSVNCWGANVSGQLGDGTTSASLVPVAVSGLTGALDLTAGEAHTCAVMTDGGVKCWGANSSGQLGDGTTTQRLAPTDALLGPQSMTFTPPATGFLGTPITLSATASSGLAASFDTWTPTICSVSGPTLTPNAEGLCGVRASQSGSAGYFPAPQQLRVLVITKIPQAITFATLLQKVTTDAAFTVSATGGASGNPVTFASLTASVCTVGIPNNSTVTLTGTPGLCTLQASQAGGGNYAAATPVSQSFAVRKAFGVILEGGQETPVNASAAAGSGAAIVDVTVNKITLTINFGGLSSAITAAHLHGPAPRGVSAGVKLNLSPTATQIFEEVTYNEADEADILNGLWYVNVHTVNFPNGEIRGQLDNVNAVPRFTLTAAKSGAGSGTVTSDVGGITCGLACTYSAPSGLQIVLTAAPASNSNFTGWSGGGCSGTSTCTVTMDAAKTVTASFAVKTWSVTSSGNAGGTITPLGLQTVNHNAQPTFTVTPNAGFFVAMGGSCGGSLVGTTYTANAVTGDCTVTASFSQSTYTVTSSAGANGSITPSGGQTVNHGAQPTFTVTPSAGFTASVGGTCGGSLVGNTFTAAAVTGPCTVTASFSQNTYTVTASAGANGTIAPSGAQTVNHGGTRTFTVTPNAGFTAVVNGTCGGSLAGTTYTTSAITANCTVTASFTQNSYTLTITKSGAGVGLVASTVPLAAIECGATCSASFPHGTAVTLIAQAAIGSAFAGWDGACPFPGNCIITMDGPKTINAVFNTANPARMSNISTRMQVLSGNDVMIAGFIIGGPVAKTVVINVAGPNLVQFGILNALLNPKLTLVRQSDQVILATNDDWQSQAIPGDLATLTASGFQPNNLNEPAIIATLPPGAYTAIVEGNGATTGVGLVGVFEVDHPEVPLVNISTRGQVQTGNDVMIAGFIVGGDAPKTVVINVAGPNLVQYGITNALLNPTLTLVRSSDQTIIATNDDWQTQTNPADVAAITATGFQPNNPAEPAIIATLPPGAYTAIVQGAGNTTGVGLVGVFAVP